VYVGVTLTRSKVKVNITGLLISEAVHAGGDDRSPLAGLSGYKLLVVLIYY